MTKVELISQVAGRANLTKAETGKALEALIQTIITTLQAGSRLSLPGLGVFSVSERPERTGRNPRTGLPPQDRSQQGGEVQSGEGVERGGAAGAGRQKKLARKTGKTKTIA